MGGSTESKKRNPAAVIMGDDVIFSLDIGTRSVVGILGRQAGFCYEVLDYEVAFHEAHAMRDGQIEDIEIVSQAVARVKEALETRHGIKLTKVAIAAAGRTLITVSATHIGELDESETITQEMIQSMEYSVVSAAQEVFREQHGLQEFFCVGYSIISYKLDNYAFSNLLGHRGKIVELEGIAAFLPNHVVESLYAVTSRNGLEVSNLTLEPIAAINTVVPKDLRMLNIGLVDIGAGTSDIAISRAGSIVAYGMATIAGDEITESIMEKYLTDFETAEGIKIDWSTGQDEIRYQDIFGQDHALKPEEIGATCADAIDQLSETIAADMLRINGAAPAAVFLVGGGSRTPGLSERLAARMEMPKDRVNVGGKPTRNIILNSEKLLFPEFVTPIGIGVVSALYRGCNFFSITVNNRSVMVISQGEIKVMDALLLAGIKPTRLIGLSSKSICFTLNGETVTERGEPSTPGLILVNGEEASVQDLIKQGDVITTMNAEDGKPPVIRISDLIKDKEAAAFTVDGKKIQIDCRATVNGAEVGENYLVKFGDSIEIDTPRTVRALMNEIGIPIDEIAGYSVNGRLASADSAVKPGDNITTVSQFAKEAEEAPPPPPAVSEPIPEPAKDGPTFNVCINDEWHRIPGSPDEPLIFADLLTFINVDTARKQGTLKLRINGSDASYIDKVAEGDNVEIIWEN